MHTDISKAGIHLLIRLSGQNYVCKSYPDAVFWSSFTYSTSYTTMHGFKYGVSKTSVKHGTDWLLASDNAPLFFVNHYITTY